MGNCITKTSDISTMDKTIIVTDDRPYEERNRQEIMDSETRQMIASMNRNRWD